MNSNPLVSVGAINYNNGAFVIETLDSIKEQSYDNIELIIVDDCSTDNSLQLISDWLLSYNKPYKFIRHPKNLGVCATCNDLLKNATGKYLSIIATDDIMMPDKLKVQVDILEHTGKEVGAVYSDAVIINEDSSVTDELFIQRYRKFETFPSGNLYRHLIKGNFLPTMSVLVKMDCYKVIGVFDEELIFEDYDMWLRMSRKFDFIYSDYVSVKYRIRRGSLMSVTRNWDASSIKILSKHVSETPELIKRLEDFAVGSYCNKDQGSINNLKPVMHLSLKLRVAVLLHTLRIPQVFGLFIIKRVASKIKFKQV